MEILISRTSLETVHYTKMKRDDTYESIRQLIDDIDSMHHIFFVYAFDKSLIENENAGLKSYQALWMRIQNEIVGERFNRFSDMADMDRLAAQEYTPDVIVAISESLARRRQNTSIEPLDRENARELITSSHTGSVGMAQLILNAMEVKKHG
ncbi:MAG: ATP-binding protein [Lachnospiraceae bacterium]|nr:ATP-binding protein [Lachnospiraceae bacterium]